MESLVCLLPSGSVPLWGKGSEKESWPLPTILFGRKLSSSSRPDARHFSVSLYAACAFQAATLGLELAVSLSESIYWSFNRNCLGLKKFLPPTQSLLLFTTRNYRHLSSSLWNPGLRSVVWAWNPSLPRYPSQILPTTCGCGTSLFHISMSPTILDKCGFF